MAPAARIGSGRRIRVPIGDWPSGLYVARLRGPGGRGAGAVRRSAEACSASTASQSSCRRTPGRRTTCATSTATASATPGTRSAGVTSVDLVAAVPRPRRAAAVPRLRPSASCAGSLYTVRARDFLADDDLERVRDGRSAGAALRPDRLPRPRGVRDDARLRRDRALPRPRRQPRLPLREQLLLPRRTARPAPVHGPGRWRDLGRPEAALVGVQYVDWNQNRYPNRPYTVTGASRAAVAVRAARGFGDGDRFGALRDRDRREDVALAARQSRCSHGSATPSAPARAPR